MRFVRAILFGGTRPSRNVLKIIKVKYKIPVKVKTEFFFLSNGRKMISGANS